MYRATHSEGIVFEELSDALTWIAEVEGGDVAGALRKVVSVSHRYLDTFEK